MADLLRSSWGALVALALIAGALVADRLGWLEHHDEPVRPAIGAPMERLE